MNMMLRPVPRFVKRKFQRKFRVRREDAASPFPGRAASPRARRVAGVLQRED